MDEQRVNFLFGDRVDVDELAAWDLSDMSEREALLAEVCRSPEAEEGSQAALMAAFESVLANQVLDDNPPDTWMTAERLLATGLGPEAVRAQLLVVISQWITEVIEHGVNPDPTALSQRLAELPLPALAETWQIALDLAAAEPGMSLPALIDAVAGHIGVTDPGTVAFQYLDAAVRRLEVEGDLLELGDGRVVVPHRLAAAMVLTHEILPAERDLGIISIVFDLAAFAGHAEPHLADGIPFPVLESPMGPVAWDSLAEVIAAVPDGGALALRVDFEGMVDTDVLDVVPPPDPGLVARVRALVTEEEASTGLPMMADALTLSLQLDDPTTFSLPVAPLSVLVAAAGLGQRGPLVAAEGASWYAQALLERDAAVRDALEDEDDVDVVLEALDLADALVGVPYAESDAGDSAVVTRLLDALDDPHRLTGLLVELVDGEAFRVPATVESGSGDAAAVAALTERGRALTAALVGGATSGRQRAIAHWLAAVVEERAPDPDAAEEHLRAANDADVRFAPATDRLAWCRADRGDAVGALRLWERLEPTDVILADKAAIRRVQELGHRPGLGRNDRCWCGSGRKFKQCHGRPCAEPDLPDRVPWLYRKALAFLDRRGGEAAYAVAELAATGVSESTSRASFERLMSDPLLADLVLVEGGWFERFLVERGALLPSDERELAERWLGVERSIFEVKSVAAGKGVVLELLDVEDGPDVEVYDPYMTDQVRPGLLLCARAVPDGRSHQIVGGVVPLARSRLDDAREALASGDPLEIALWARDQARPIVLQGPESD